ncbi:MAG: ABC transporter permease [Dermatophilaceae bacterium]
MSWLETVRTAYEAIRVRRMRSALTMLGILIGIAAVMLTVGLGQGAQKQVTDQINKLGSNLLIVTPGSTTSVGGVRGGFGSATTLTVDDAALLADAGVCPDLAAVAPTSQTSTALVAGSASWTANVVGTSPDWPRVRARSVVQGRFFTAADVLAENAVAVLGSTTASQLFGAQSAVGQSIGVKGQTFTVIGLLDTEGSTVGGDQDDLVVVPVSTYAARVTTSSNPRAVSTIYLEAKDPQSLSAAYQEASNALLNAHGVTAAAADFTVSSQQAIVDTATTTTRILTVLLASIAAISLLVGGIGVMNIMLVSVTERIREIGLRKALGATPAAIRRQFLVEASMLGLAGGLAGLALGVVGALALTRFITITVAISPLASAVALVVSLSIGVVAGVYPASRAARLAPIDALRSE